MWNSVKNFSEYFRHSVDSVNIQPSRKDLSKRVISTIWDCKFLNMLLLWKKIKHKTYFTRKSFLNNEVETLNWIAVDFYVTKQISHLANICLCYTMITKWLSLFKHVKTYIISFFFFKTLTIIHHILHTFIFKNVQTQWRYSFLIIWGIAKEFKVSIFMFAS